MAAASLLARSVRTLKAHYPWISTPLVVQAPMRILSGPKLAVAASGAGGIGMIGPGEKPEALQAYLEEAAELVSKSPLSTTSSGVLPVGFEKDCALTRVKRPLRP